MIAAAGAWLLKNWKAAALAAAVAGLVWFGHGMGARGVQAKWDAAEAKRLAAELASAEERTAAVVAEVKASNAQAKADAEAALQAAQERQAERVRAAARAGALEGATRKPGTVYTECRLGEAERQILEEAMR